MILIIITIIAMGFYMAYQTSSKITVQKFKLGLWLYQYSTVAKFISLVLIAVATVIGIYQLGFGVGIFYAGIVLMTVSSLVILLYPIYFPKN